MSELTATGPVLVHFFDHAQLNSVRAMPYLKEWRRRYEPLGLRILGIHSPRFRFSAEKAAFTRGVERLGLEHPVADDAGYSIWHDYGVKGWPSLFLWARGGALAWFHFGEGEYQTTETAIQELLRADDLTVELPEPMAPLRATDAPGALVAPPSPEVFPGGGPGEPWESGSGDALEITYEAGEAWLVAEGGDEVRAAIDGGEAIPLQVGDGPLLRIAEHPGHEKHDLRVEASPGVRVWAVSFAPGTP